MTDLPDISNPESPPAPGLRIHPPEIWDMARSDYLAGLSGPSVCARYGLGLAAFRKRAATGGWRRIDQPAPAPMTPLQIDGDLEEADYFDLAEMSAIHLREAIVNGRIGEATAWLRLHLRLHDVSHQELCMARATGAYDLEAVDSVDGIDGVFSAPESTLSPGTRPHPETPVPPASSHVPAPGCDAESDRSGR
jgi:hypothetical protein